MTSEDNLTRLTAERFKPWQRAILTAAVCAATTLLATPLLGHLDLANIVMLFLLTVLLIAVSLGRGAAVLAAVLSVLLFDIFFVPPRFSLAVENAQYLVTFAVMLATGLIAGQLAAVLKQKAREAEIRERNAQALYDVARQLAGTLAVEQAVDIARQFIRAQFEAEGAVLLRGDDGSLPADAPAKGFRIEPHLARVALDTGQAVHDSEIGGSGYASHYLPLRSSQQVRGVLAIAFLAGAPSPTPERLASLKALASLLAIAVERHHYVDVAQTTQVDMVAERLRSSILSALSNDLRTPLTALVGLADSLSLIRPPLPQPALETAQAMHEQAARLDGLLGNLLDMARLNAGEVTLRRDWQSLEEVIGAGIRLLGGALTDHSVRVALPADLPLLKVDAVLLERVFCNLLENAAKFAPGGAPIEITAELIDDCVAIRVCDRGPGFPAGDRSKLFDMFARGGEVATRPGTRLGLTISRAIVEAHGGTIAAEDRADGGACVRFTLPRGTPPVVEEESA